MASDTRHEVPCTDVAGRKRAVCAFPLAGGGVGIQPPPGEWFELDGTQLRDLLVAAREAMRESHDNYAPVPRTIVAGGTCS